MYIFNPGLGNPIFPVAAIKTQSEREAFSTLLSVGRVYRSDTGHFETEGSTASIIRRFPQDPFADTSLNHDGTACVVMRDTYPPTEGLTAGFNPILRVGYGKLRYRAKRNSAAETGRRGDIGNIT